MNINDTNVWDGSDPCECGHPFSVHDYYLQVAPGKFSHACGVIKSAFTYNGKGEAIYPASVHACRCREFTIEPLFYVASHAKQS